MLTLPVPNMRSPKVCIIGAGNVGGTLAHRLVENDLADVVLYDIVQGKPQGIALDLMQARAIANHDRQIIGTNDFSDTKDADIIVLTAGLPRKEGMSRDDLLRINASIVKDVIPKAIAQSPDAILIVVTNPLDIMTYLAWQVSGLPPHRVMGMAGVLDAARFQAFIGMELGISDADIRATVLGGHGDTMVPLPRFSTVNGVPITELMSQNAIASIIQRTRHGGAEVVKLMQTSAYFAPSAAACAMIRAILYDQHRLMFTAAYLTGKYGLTDLFIGVPVQLGRRGIEKVIELQLTSDETSALHNSATSIRESINLLPQIS
ncbi:malate dehydrogenase [Pseudanabaena yagii]|uniref:Malate dehydrogenase n=1 Tax=Pseudanabaena yagii GIHE-NHR1 TaxID=2722753 RepID=A0ABX1LXI2_9CYAN|nr:malate dehydrogenase [Pseudanabaena yagii]NMF60920.1 malate dehydrogenase [Pseudanabaena yagii GIHE-NHR1]